MHQLEIQKPAIAANVDSLSLLNSDLDSLLNNLSADGDTIAVYARELGFVAEGEHLIRLAGFSGGIKRTVDPGIRLEVASPAYLPEWVCKLFGFFSALAVLITEIIVYRGKRYNSAYRKPEALIL